MTRNKHPLYNTSEYRRRKRAFILSAPPVCTWPSCPVPGRAIDISLSGNHAFGPTVDHRHPTSAGGDFWAGWQLMHRRCNLQKGDRPMPTTYPADLLCKCGELMYPRPGSAHACW